MSETQYLLDSNFIIALMDGKDVYHQRASKLFDQIQGDGNEIFLSDLLINETLSVFAKRCEAQKREADFQRLAKKFLESIQGLPLLCLYDLFNEKLNRIVDIMIHHRARFNFHDALMLLLLQEIPEVVLVTFDTDFKDLPDVKVLAN